MMHGQQNVKVHSYFTPAPFYHPFPALSDSSPVCRISRWTHTAVHKHAINCTV